MSNPLALKLSRRDVLSPEEQAVLENAISRVELYEAREDMVHEGERPTESSLLVEGWAARYNLLKNGDRQITDLHMMGDFVDLHSLLLRPMDHSIVALTSCRVAKVPHETLREITRTQPHLSRLLWMSTLVDAAIHRHWLRAMGRQSALSHLAHLLCELYVRLNIVEQTDGYSFNLPLTQSALGDALGLSTVHVNRTVQTLRYDGLIAWRGERVIINDWNRLATLAEFDPTYLNLSIEAR